MAKGVQEGALRSVEDLDVIVDADVHPGGADPEGALLEYMEDEHALIREWIEDEAEIRGASAAVFSATVAAPMQFTKADTDLHPADFGIDTALVGPTPLNRIGTINNARYQVALAKAYNNWALDEFEGTDRGVDFRGQIVVPPARPDVGAEEIERLADEDVFVGVAMPPCGFQPPLGHRQYDPVFEAAERRGLPIFVHGTQDGFQSTFPRMFEHTETYAEGHCLSFMFQTLWNVVTTTLRGVPARFPDLKFVWQEIGIAWVPYLTWRMNDCYLEQTDDMPHLEKLPSEYAAESYYYATQPIGNTGGNPRQYAQMIDLIGPDRILYASDWPHTTFDPPEELFELVRGAFDDDAVRGMMGENAKELCGL